MIARLRELMSTPFARPPGRRSLWVRFAPEWCALLVYVVFLATSQWKYEPGYPLVSAWAPGMIYAYLWAGALLLTVPVSIMAGGFAAEREGGVADMLALTTADRSTLTWGRFLHLALPWLRFFAWLLPLYVLQGIFLGFEARGVMFSIAYAGCPKPCAALVLSSDVWHVVHMHVSHKGVRWEWSELLVVFPRMINDAIQLLAAMSLAYYLGARVTRTRMAMVVACVLVPGGATVFAAIEFLVVTLFPPLSLVALAFKIWLVFWLVRKVARNFDAYLLGEKP